MAVESVTIPAVAIPDLRRMLAIGLAALGEIERVRDHFDLERQQGRDIPGNLVPLHPTGAHEMGEFATALMWLDQTLPVED